MTRFRRKLLHCLTRRNLLDKETTHTQVSECITAVMLDELDRPELIDGGPIARSVLHRNHEDGTAVVYYDEDEDGNVDTAVSIDGDRVKQADTITVVVLVGDRLND